MALRDVTGERIRAYTLDGETKAFDCRKEADELKIVLHEVPAYMAIEVL